MKKTYQSINYTDMCGDMYSRWANTNKNVKDAMMLTVTDKSGNVVFCTIVRKNNVILQNLSMCRFACDANYQSFLKKETK